jgi:hypothetical protein
MTVLANIDIILDIAGPFLCSGTAPSTWGLDASFDRDYLGRPYIDRSHIKGKLREALEELGTAATSLDTWFGRGGEMNNGLCRISDFRLNDAELEKKLTDESSVKTLTRIRKDPVRKVVDPTAMFVVEDAFPGASDNSYQWHGTITCYMDDTSAADTFHATINEGLKWTAAFGAEKGVGFGRLKAVTTNLSTEPVKIDLNAHITPAPQLTITIKPEEPLLLGDLRMKDNYLESREYIGGNAIKAALAQGINTALGIKDPARTPIDKTSVVANSFPRLAKYFEHIRFTHAFPTISNKRPAIIPFSLVKTGDQYHDVALEDGPKLFDDKAPIFQTDWKASDYPDSGWAFPRRFTKTRTAIDKITRRADDGSMFTFQYICPVTNKGEAISWVGGISLSGLTLDPNDTIADVERELECALDFLQTLGKRGSLVTATLTPEPPVPYCPMASWFKDKLAIITLQADTLMVNPEDLVQEQTAEKLLELYKAYWDTMSGSSLELVRFFATQKLRGGYLHRRRRTTPSSYYPFYLTEAGSVFVLKVINEATAKTKVEGWLNNGLMVPGWVQTRYGKNGEPLWKLWKYCPFIPENGFGEVAVNHPWEVKEVKGGTES